MNGYCSNMSGEEQVKRSQSHFLTVQISWRKGEREINYVIDTGDPAFASLFK